MAKDYTRHAMAASFALHIATAGIVALFINANFQKHSDTATTISLSSFNENRLPTSESRANDTAPKERQITKTVKNNQPKTAEGKKQDEPQSTKSSNDTHKQQEATKAASTQPPAQSSATQQTKVDESDEYARLYRGKIKEIVSKYQTYPIAARKSGCEGICQVSFRLHPNGHIDETKVVKSSGYVTLDRSSIRAIEDAAPELPKPKQIVTLIIPVEYKL